MSVLPVSAPFDPFDAPPVTRIAEDVPHRDGHQDSSGRQELPEKHAPPAETPHEGAEPAAEPGAAGSLIDVRV